MHIHNKPKYLDLSLILYVMTLMTVEGELMDYNSRHAINMGRPEKALSPHDKSENKSPFRKKVVSIDANVRCFHSRPYGDF